MTRTWLFVRDWGPVRAGSSPGGLVHAPVASDGRLWRRLRVRVKGSRRPGTVNEYEV